MQFQFRNTAENSIFCIEILDVSLQKRKIGTELQDQRYNIFRHDAIDDVNKKVLEGL